MGQNIAFCAPRGEEMAAGNQLWRWGVCLTYRGGQSREVNLASEQRPLSVMRDRENMMASGREEPMQDLAGKGSREKITSSSLAGAGGATALGRPKRGGRQHLSQGFAKECGGVKGNSP